MSAPATGLFTTMAAMLRVRGRITAMGGLLVAGVILFQLWKLLHLSKDVSAHNPWARWFLAGIARISGVRIRTTGMPAPGRLLMLANHVSWIDIPALAATTGTAFVAHDGLAGVPVLKWLCRMNDTVFVARHDPGSIGAQIEILRVALADKNTITVFAEGTTSDGSNLLPFKSSLLAALDPLANGIAVQPVWLDYGPHASTIAWAGVEPGMVNFRRILARAKPVELTIHFLEPLAAQVLANRKTMAAAARLAITDAMAGVERPLQIPCALP